ncbi:hypothetical protein HMPREF9442_00942 [Paraprevotella xylaniphila YIT 11841]|uniref:Uncharacterized protein n=1 Tax=Paraprevotella xylaniphila YIT 11841 TaxID=762982 RepID=F3QRY6_9BACT|nr:hypothetical protein HMPREF9442_00942 [Paraprevotella xylaniphila YIT 11841]
MFSIVLVIIYYVNLSFCVCFMLLPAKLQNFLVGWKNKCGKILLKKCNIGTRYVWRLFRKLLKSLFEINDTKMRVYGTKRKIIACLGRERMIVKNTIQTIFTSFPLCFFTVSGCF